MSQHIKSGITFGIIGGLLTFIFGGWSVLIIGILMGVGLGLVLGGRFKRKAPVLLAREAVPVALVSSGILLAMSLLQNFVIAPAIGSVPRDLDVVIPANSIGVLGGFAMILVTTALHGLPPKQEQIGKLVIIAVVVVAFPFIDNFTGLRWIAQVIFALIFVILGMGLNIVVGYAGLLDLGYAAFFAIGAYTTGILSSPQHNIYLNFWLCIWISAAVAAIFGLLLGAPTLPLRGDYLAIVTLGFGEIIRVFILNIDAVGGARGFGGIPKYSSFGWVYFFAIASIVVVSRIVNSSFGRTLLAVREDEIAAEAMGVHTTRSKVISFVISSAMAGVAGGLFAHYLMYIHTNSFTFLKSIEIIIMIVLGGMGSITGSVVGAVLYIVLTEGLRAFEQYRMVTFSLLLVLIMIFRPQGLMGHRELFGRKRREARQPAAPTIEA